MDSEKKIIKWYKNKFLYRWIYELWAPPNCVDYIKNLGACARVYMWKNRRDAICHGITDYTWKSGSDLMDAQNTHMNARNPLLMNFSFSHTNINFMPASVHFINASIHLLCSLLYFYYCHDYFWKSFFFSDHFMDLIKFSTIEVEKKRWNANTFLINFP